MFSDCVRQDIAEANNNYCENPDCISAGSDFHHKLPNTKINRSKYPLFIDSPFNCAFLCRNCHINKKPKTKEKLAQVYENYLRTITNPQ